MSEDITPVEEPVDVVEPPAAFTKTASRVCIVGFADGHRADAPFGEPDMEFWGINRLHAALPDRAWDRWFEIHDLAKFYSDDEEHKAFLKSAQFPVYVRGQDLPQAVEWGIETAVPYPRDAVAAQFLPYFNNTVSYLLALAIMMEYEEIHLYGVDMAVDTILHAEFSHQRPSCEWLIGIAQGRGVKVVLPPGSDILKTSHWYGFEDNVYRSKLEARIVELGTKKEQVRAEMNEYGGRVNFLQARISELDGSMQEIQYQLKNLVTPEVG